MKITLYFINFNDSFYLPFLKEHYGKFCQRIVMYDNYSTDESVEIAKSLGFEVRYFGKRGQLNDQHYLDVKNHVWKEERGKGVDYVIVCDADEFVTVPSHMNCSLPSMDGFDMVSDTLPVESIFEVKYGFLNMNYAKQAIFSPDRIEEINFVHGCHRNRAIGDITRHDDCRMYHFRWIGGPEPVINRHALYRSRMSDFNSKHGMGNHYGKKEMTEEEVVNFNNQKRIEYNHYKSIINQIF